MRNISSPLFACAVLFACPAAAEAPAPLTPTETTQDAIAMLKRAIGFKSVEGSPEILAYAKYLAGELKAAGFADADIEIDSSGPAPTLVATLKGASAEKPILLSGHLDVVEADPADWTRDPFTAVEENGYILGRGAVDNKFDVTMMTITMMRLKREGFKPARDVILVFSGDEETTMASTARLAEKFKHAGLLLNGDGGGGTLGENDAPVIYNLQNAEKTYADFELSFANPGGHSSRPSKENAIYRLARAIDRIAAFDFPAQSTETTREFFRQSSAMTGGPLGAAMKRFSEKPTDKKAIKALRADPEYVGQLGTTCVATMLDGGHALNALPQKASVSINCRIFPGVSAESVRETLLRVVDDPAAELRRLDNTFASDASPMRDEIVAAVRKAIDRRYKDLPVTPQMSSGATDSLYFRSQGVDSYGVAGLFLKPSDDFSHGLNERAPIAAIDGALDHWHVLITEIAGAATK